MHRLSTLLRRTAEVLEVTEPEAMALYLRHMRECQMGCGPGKPKCPRAMKLHDQWKQAEKRQPAPHAIAGGGRR